MPLFPKKRLRYMINSSLSCDNYIIFYYHFHFKKMLSVMEITRITEKTRCDSSISLLQIFRETKENEIQNLLKAKRDLEVKGAKLNVSTDDPEATSKAGLNDTSLGKWSLHSINYHCLNSGYWGKLRLSISECNENKSSD